MSSNDPKVQAIISRRIVGYNNDKWYRMAPSIIYMANKLKFSQNKYMRNTLLGTKNKPIIYCHPRDKFLGICRSISYKHLFRPRSWRGQNVLGNTLVQIRSELTK